MSGYSLKSGIPPHSQLEQSHLGGHTPVLGPQGPVFVTIPKYGSKVLTPRILASGRGAMTKGGTDRGVAPSWWSRSLGDPHLFRVKPWGGSVA